MFLKNKKQDEIYRRLEERLRILEQGIATGNRRLGSLGQGISQLGEDLAQGVGQLGDTLGQNISQLESSIQKHDMAIEDLLDEWDEKKSDEESVKESLCQSRKDEKLLLSLFEGYQEQFWSLKRFAAAKDASWSAQIALMEQNLEQCRRSCGISVIQECGVSVDYNLHEAIEAVDTDDPGLDKTVADIYRPGYIYKGKVQRKAQVAAYRIIRNC